MVRSLEGKHPSYYEAVLQLRDCSEDIIDYVREQIDKKDIPLAKIVRLKKGIDFFLADNQFTRALGKKLQVKFGGDYQVTSSLWGRKSGKEVYRLTVLFRYVGFRKHDKVEYQGEKYQVKMLLGTKVMLQKEKTGEKIQVRFRDIGEVKLVSN
tara:strand:+ start:134 stop:592 length:459 start_codon:yes stop_codon:yes gene_type:complete